MRVLILGGTGFLGPQIAERLAASGHEITIFHRDPTGAGSGRRFPEVHGDRNKLDESSEDLRRVCADVVVDVIAFTERQAESLVDVFRGHAERLVVLSSGDVYRANDILFRRVEGTIDPTPLAESAPLRERLNPYRGMPIPERYGFSWDDYDKIPVERTVMREISLPATVLRLPMVFGPGVHDVAQRRFFPYLKRMDDRRGAILLDQRTARWRAPWGFSGDVAEAVRLAVENESAKGEIYNVGESGGLDTESWVRELGVAAGWKGEVVTTDGPCPAPSVPLQLNLEQHLDMDTTKIRRDLGYRETMSRRAALEMTVAWDREHWPTEIDPAQFDYATEDAVLSGKSRESS
ncbi:MAG: NAD-dependent epimerase/dehydratase family protein [Acidobacteriia bacterium]|nr:NAD-dependent epimerase/dehydratase family protein [Terriglobia bacterium]